MAFLKDEKNGVGVESAPCSSCMMKDICKYSKDFCEVIWATTTTTKNQPFRVKLWTCDHFRRDENDPGWIAWTEHIAERLEAGESRAKIKMGISEWKENIKAYVNTLGNPDDISDTKSGEEEPNESDVQS